jgi:DNA-binding transcriptional ArsR family regulator
LRSEYELPEAAMGQSKDDSSVVTLAALLANQTRLAILRRLLEAPCNVGELVAALGLEQAVVSKQLRVLGEAGLLECRPEGRCRFYRSPRARALRRVLAALGGLAAEAGAVQEGRAKP